MTTSGHVIQADSYKMKATKNLLASLFLSLICIAFVQSVRYMPTWDSLDSRPLPEWYDKAKIGIFIHWGVFSVPSFSSEWFWEQWKGQKLAGVVDFMQKNYPPGFTYADFAPHFTAEFYNAEQWADILEASGAKYVVLVSKHHEGFCNWPSKYSFNWNAGDVGPNRDLVGELADAIRNKTDIHFGMYHSMFEWYHPLFLQDQANNFKTQDFVRDKTLPELYEIVNKYKPEVIWSDGDWMVDDTYWNATQFLAWLYNDSPVKDKVCVNDRWGKNIRCKHGGFLNCNDKYNPGTLQKRKWENCMTIDRYSWGYRRNARFADFLDMDDLTKEIATTVSCGGNLLVNIGPTHDGRIVPMFEERLRQMGAWLNTNGEAIYESKPWTHQNDTVSTGVWYTSKKSDTGTSTYAIVLDWPANNQLTLGAPSPSSSTTIRMLGYEGKIDWKKGPQGGMVVQMPIISINKLPSQYAWVFRIDGLNN